ncbi:MAG: hypothetical protein AAF993_07865 [Pseudomonadota bacterium]
MTTSSKLARFSVLFGILFVPAVAGCDEGQTAQSPRILELPKNLREISGLTTADGYLFAIADEVGQVYRIDYDAARIKRWLTFGQPAVAGDFEGLALADKALYATTSEGVLYRSESIGAAQASDYQRFDTGVGKLCEVEGLTASPDEKHLWLLCKTPAAKRDHDTLFLYAWSVANQSRLPAADIRVGYADFPGADQDKKVRLYPSAVGVVDNTELWVLAARNKMLLKLTIDGTPLALQRLPDRKNQPQAEGFVALPGAVYIANEAGKKGKRGTLLEYQGRL